MDKFNEARLSYYKSVLAVENEKDLDLLLTASCSDNYQEILQGYIDILTIEIKEYMDLVNNEKSLEIRGNFFRNRVDVCE